MSWRSVSLLCGLAVSLAAQTAPPQATPVPPQMSPVPNRAGAPAGPTVTMSVENPKPLPSVPPDKVIITVGDLKITAAQFNMICDSLPEQSRASARGPARKLFADQLVKVLALASEGHRRKLDENEAYRVQTSIQNANLLAGMTFDAIAKEAKIGDAELKTYYDTHKSDYEQVHAFQILIRMQNSPIAVKPGQKDLTDAEALAKAQEVRKKLVDGADFSTLALAESDDPQSQAKGGDLGTFKRGHMVPAAEEVAFSMKPGEISQPIKSVLGYHVIKLESKSMTKTFEEAKPELEGKARPEIARKAMEDLQKTDTVVLDPEFFGTAK